MSATSEPRTQSVSIGVTGHRVLTEIEKVAAGVGRALEAIERNHPGKSLAGYSSLAEGADRIVAKFILQRPGARLIVPLPLPRADYTTDFATPESRREFDDLMARADEVIQLPAVDTRDDAYNLASRYVVDHADVLIAVWDGLPGQGRAGTAHAVEYARRCQRPIAWIRAGNGRPGTMEPISLGELEGTITFEGF